MKISTQSHEILSYGSVCVICCLPLNNSGIFDFLFSILPLVILSHLRLFCLITFFFRRIYLKCFGLEEIVDPYLCYYPLRCHLWPQYTAIDVKFFHATIKFFSGGRHCYATAIWNPGKYNGVLSMFIVQHFFSHSCQYNVSHCCHISDQNSSKGWLWRNKVLLIL